MALSFLETRRSREEVAALFGIKTPEQISQRRRHRIAMCGCRAKVRHASSGVSEDVSFFCGAYRECEDCASHRGDLFRERILFASTQDDVYQVDVDDETASEIVSELGKEKVFRLPKNGRNVLFVSTPEYGGEKVTFDTARQINWADLARTDPERKISGGLGKLLSSPKPVTDDQVTVEVPVIVANVPAEVFDKAEAEAIKATLFLDPQTEQELVDALRERNAALLAALYDAGTDSDKILVESKFETVQTSRLRWFYLAQVWLREHSFAT